MKNGWYTESFKGYEFYWVILPLGIRWALMKYHIKPLGMTKTQDLYGCDLFFIPVDAMWTLQQHYDKELIKAILKNSTDFY